MIPLLKSFLSFWASTACPWARARIFIPLLKFCYSVGSALPGPQLALKPSVEFLSRYTGMTPCKVHTEVKSSRHRRVYTLSDNKDSLLTPARCDMGRGMRGLRR